MQKEIQAAMQTFTALFCNLESRISTLEKSVGELSTRTADLQVIGVDPVTQGSDITSVVQVTGDGSGVALPPIDSNAELDDEGVPWDERIHAKTKGKVASKEVKNGQKWRMKKGCDFAEYERIKNEIRQVKPTDVGATPTPSSPSPVPDNPNPPPVPAKTTPAVPGTPVVPGLPGAEPLQPDPETARLDALKVEAQNCIKSLMDNFGVEIEDLKEVLVTEFQAAQNGDQVVFGSLRNDQIEPMRNFFVELVNKYQHIQNMIARIYEIGGAANRQAVVDGLVQIYTNFNTTIEHGLAGVHYSQIDSIADMITNWLTQWEATLTGN